MLSVDDFLLPDKGTTKPLEYVGTSIWGLIYKDKSGSSYYRIIPIDEIRDAEKRATIHKEVEKPRRRLLAPIVEAEQRVIDGNVYYIIRYEISPETDWKKLSKTGNPEVVFSFAERICRTLPLWWKMLREGLLPTPSDIVFVKGDPYLLYIPEFLGYPGISSLFSNTTRILYLAPEILRSQDSIIRGKNLDIYALGVILLECFYSHKMTKNPDILLQRAASGSLFEREKMDTRLPFWTENVDKIQSLEKLFRRSIDPEIKVRSRIDPDELADSIKDSLPHFNPLKSVDVLRRNGKADKAYSLIQDIFLSTTSSELLIQAGRLAKDDLKRPLEAVRFFERAIQKSPNATEAFRNQLELLLDKTVLAGLILQSETRHRLTEKLDDMIWRDFYGLPVVEQKKHVENCARYYIGRKKFQNAAKLIYNFLFEGKTKFLWWEFGKTLLYAETMIGMNRHEEAESFLEDIKNKLIDVRDTGKMLQEEVHMYGGELSRLRTMLFEQKRKGGQGKEGSH